MAGCNALLRAVQWIFQRDSVRRQCLTEAVPLSFETLQAYYRCGENTSCK